MSDDISEITARHTYGTWRAQRGWSPINVTRAEGCYFWDASGKRYLDLSSQLICSNLGHQNQAVIDAICAQARELAFISPSHTCDVRAKLALKLLEVMPKGLDKFFFATSGTEANEAAIKIARMVTGKHKIIARYTSYHGSTAGAVAAPGDLRRWFIEPEGKIGGVVFGPEVNCYRCPLGQTYPQCNVACADYLSYMIDHEENVAAIIVEPIVGTNGVLVPPAEYLPKVAAQAKKRGVLLIADEVMTGFGRTGAWFGVDHWGVRPDILVAAKGATSGYWPFGFAAASGELYDAVRKTGFTHGFTYSHQPVAAAVAGEVLRILETESLVGASLIKGAQLQALLHERLDEHPAVGDIRGRGLMVGVELVKDRATKAPYPRSAKLVESVVRIAREHGLLLYSGTGNANGVDGDVILLGPPFVITEAELARLADGLRDALDAALAGLG
jgi:taurine--2-oxoglutarate transaminase